MNIEEQTQWKTPGDVMKKIRVRKIRKDVTRKSTFGNSSLVSSKITDATLATADASSVTRLNPYSCKRKSSEVNVVQKKRILSCSDYDNVAVAITQTENHSPLDSHLGSDEIKSKENMEPPLPPPKQNHFQMDVALQSLMLKSEAEKEGKIDNANKISENLPVDWTIKKKVRFLSQSPFTWCSRMKSAEEALCILKATRDYRSTTDEVQNAKTTDFDQKSWRIALGSFLTYWQHPCIPWLTLFPRFGLDQRIVHGKSTVSLSDEVVRALYDSWVIGFRSVYQMTQESLCPYFYILAQQYTAIFRASGVYGMNEIICILTPTTPGFRQSLKKEGIAFTMLREKKSKKIKDEIPSELADAEKVDQTKDVGEVDGISVNNTPSTNDSHTAATKDTNEKEEPEWEKIASELKFREHREILPPDNVSSAILIKGDSNTQLLFNYLLNSQSSITCSGHQTGVPPTIISPIAFQGASLQKLNIRAGVVKSFSESSFDRSKLTVTGTKKKFSMDISGPLLPDSIIKIADLLRRTQHNNGFFATFDTYSCTTPFNSSLVDNQQGGPNSNLNTESCEVINKNLAAALGPPCDLLESHLLKRSNEAITFHDLTLTENLFSWT